MKIHTILEPLELALLIITLLIVKVGSASTKAGLFGKDQRMDKLSVMNQIGYHFKKIVREVSQELFVSRRIDASALFVGITTLKQTAEGLNKYCGNLLTATRDVKVNMDNEPRFVHITLPRHASYYEAQARCKALGLQLPELYNSDQILNLNAFLRDRGIKKIFAGIQSEPTDAIYRFIATGFPVWRTPHNKVLTEDGNEIKMLFILDDLNARFLYTSEGQLMVMWENPSPQTVTWFADHKYREKNNTYSQVFAPIVCEPQWNGVVEKETNFATAEHIGLKQKPRFVRSARTKLVASYVSLQGLQEFCVSVADQANEIHKDMFNKLSDLLALVDISVHLDNSGPTRYTRSAFLAKYIFTTGVKLIWKLFTFVQRMRTNARLSRLEGSLSQTQLQVEDNSKAVSNMSLLISEHAMAINQLVITTSNMEKRLTMVEKQISNMGRTMGDIINKLEAFISIELVANLINRIQQSLNTGYDILKSIIHCSLLGQTSPLLLPTDQLQLVQSEVRKVSTGVLDTDFSKMQSIVVSDPQDPHLLLVVVNMAALNRKNVELVNIVPVPYYKEHKAYALMLDYTAIILDQLARTYSILNEQEEHDCLSGRCYVSDVERSLGEKTCGIPQLYDQHLDVCVAEEVQSTGVFIKPMLPDGIIFSLKDEVDTQLFCKDNEVIGPLNKLRGTGIMHLPNGCILSVTDKQGRNTKVKGQPLYRMVDAEDLTLTMNGPLEALQAISSRNFTHKLNLIDHSFSDYLSSVVKQVETVDARLLSHKTYIWSLVGAVIALVTILLIVVIISYRNRGKFYQKIFDLRNRITEYRTAITDNRGNNRRPPSPHPSPRAVFEPPIFRSRSSNPYRLRDGVSHLSDPYISMSELANKKEGQEMCQGFRPLEPFPASQHVLRQYPRLTPLFSDLSKAESKNDVENQSADNKV